MSVAATSQNEITHAVDCLGSGPLCESKLVEHVHPLFSRVLARDEIYLANHSLGRPLDRTASDITRFIDLWYSDMDKAWTAWIEEINLFRANMATLIGLSRPDALVPKISAGQGLRAVLNALPMDTPRIVATRGEFDSIDFILRIYERKSRIQITWVEPDEHGLFNVDQINAAIDDVTDLVIASQVYYATGQILDPLDSVVAKAHQHGALALIDMYHAAGVIPCRFETLNADFAIGGSYKYTRGGPGAGWLAINPGKLDQPDFFTLDTGWFAKKETFAFSRGDDTAALAQGGDAWLESTPAPILAYQAKAGLELILEMGVERLRDYSLGQQELLRSFLTRAGVDVRDNGPHGAFLLVPDEDAPDLVQRLKTAGVNTDARLGCVRLCPDILNTQEELNQAAQIISQVIGHK